MSKIYNSIKSLCEQRDITISAMCKKAGVSTGLMTDLKMGRRNTITLPTAEKIANVLEVPISFLTDPERYTDDAERLINLVETMKHPWIALDGMIEILADIYGGIDIETIEGKYGEKSCFIFREGDSAFILEDEDIETLCESMKVIIPPIVQRLKSPRKVKDVIREIEDYLNSEEAKLEFEKKSSWPRVIKRKKNSDNKEDYPQST